MRSSNLCSVRCCIAKLSTDERINTCSIMKMSNDVSSFSRLLYFCQPIIISISLSLSLRLNYDVWHSQSAKAWHPSRKPVSPHAVSVLREHETDMQYTHITGSLMMLANISLLYESLACSHWDGNLKHCCSYNVVHQNTFSMHKE